MPLVQSTDAGGGVKCLSGEQGAQVRHAGIVSAVQTAQFEGAGTG